ncbi:MAG: hypothetical protein FWC85_01055 [Elusimicrobia bacterium]|nr:hypothetical protein [Elusimicrobiota bacterium]
MQKDLTVENAVESYGTIAERLNSAQEKDVQELLENAPQKVLAQTMKEELSKMTPLQKAITLAERELSLKETAQKSAKDVSRTEPLSHWKPDEKAFFESLPEASRKKVLDMYKGIQTVYEKKTLETAEKQKRYDLFDNIFKPYEDVFLRNKTDKFKYLKDVIEHDKFASYDPVGFVKKFIKDKNISLGALEENSKITKAGTGEPDADIKKLEAKLEVLERELNAKKLDDSQSYIEKFKTKTDENGNLKYPHIEALTPQMLKISHITGSNDLDELYNKALWLNENLRNQLIETEKQKALQDHLKKAEVSRIKNAKDFNIKPLYGSSGAALTKKSLRDIIEESEEEVNYAKK